MKVYFGLMGSLLDLFLMTPASREKGGGWSRGKWGRTFHFWSDLCRLLHVAVYEITRCDFSGPCFECKRLVADTAQLYPFMTTLL